MLPGAWRLTPLRCSRTIKLLGCWFNTALAIRQTVCVYQHLVLTLTPGYTFPYLLTSCVSRAHSVDQAVRNEDTSIIRTLLLPQ